MGNGGKALQSHFMGISSSCSSGQGDAHVGCVRAAGGSGQEHADVTEGRGRAAEPCHQRAPLATTHEVDQGLPISHLSRLPPSTILSAVYLINRIQYCLFCIYYYIIVPSAPQLGKLIFMAQSASII